ncbi:MAG: hypothetical protein EP297_10590 [Gammaproteobacteria bacterium]|nr:MAG: hypothetical protein EP297_10590 [Gammaproteobacteria bacterium]
MTSQMIGDHGQAGYIAKSYSISTLASWLIKKALLKMNEIKVYIDSNGIMCVEYPTHSNFGIHEVREEYRKRLDITNEKMPVLVKIRGIKTFSEDAQNFLCSSDNCAITSTTAVVGDSNAGYFKHSEILLELFKCLKRPPFDFKYFDDEESAIAWLKA